MRRFHPFVLVLGLGIALATSSASAQQAGQVRVSGDVDLFGFAFFPDRTTNISLGPNGLSDGIEFGGVLFGPPLTQSRGFGLGLAYLFGDDLLVGSRVRLGFSYVDPDGAGDALIGALTLLPFLEYLLGSGEVVPYLGGQAGVVLQFPDFADAQGGLVAGGLGGIHIFAASSFTVSFEGQFNFLYDFGIDRGGFDIVVLLKLAGWITP
jgi:hypothetical protein